MKQFLPIDFLFRFFGNVFSPEGKTRSIFNLCALFVIPSLMGFLIGALGFGFLHPAVESAQTIAGLVPYPKTNPFGQYHFAVFTLWHPAVALLLKIGVSERLIHHFISGSLGALNYLATATIVFSLCRKSLIAIAVPPLLHFAGLWANPITYGLAWISDFSYGISGLALSGLVIGLFASGFKRFSLFLLGLLPGIHPALGAHLHLLFALAWLIYFIQSKDRLSKDQVLSYVIGLTFTLMALGFYLWRKDLPGTPPAQSMEILQAFYRDWDCHRLPINHSPFAAIPPVFGYPPENTVPLGMIAVLFVLISTSFVVLLKRKETTQIGDFATVAFLSAALIALLAIPISRLNPASVPTPIWIAMPQRWVNFPIFFAGAWVIGILFKLVTRGWGAAALGLFCFVLLFQTGSPFGDESPVWAWVWQFKLSIPPWVLFPISFFLIAFLAIFNKYSKVVASPLPLWQKTSMLLGTALIFFVFTLAWYSEIRRAQTQTSESFSRTLNHRQVPFWSWVHQQNTMVAPAATIGRVQALSGSPILLEPLALDTLSMTPSSGLFLNQILKDIYGMDLLHVPAEARSTGMVPAGINKKVFEERTRTQWDELSHRHGFGLVITPSTWALDLPVGRSNGGLVAWMAGGKAPSP